MNLPLRWLTTPPPRDPADWLLQCHSRIRTFWDTAAVLASTSSLPDEQVSSAAGAVHRYFTTAFFLHAEDEDRDVFPALLNVHPPLEVTASLSALEGDHPRFAALVSHLAPAWETLQRTPSRRAQVRPELSEATTSLAALLSTHLATEEEVILPAFQTLVPVEVQNAVLDRMKERRRR